MTPPKPIAVRRKPSTSSPLVVSSLSFSSPDESQQKRLQGNITPEELHRLKTVPIKCREILEQANPIPIMESSNFANSTTGTVTTFNFNRTESQSGMPKLPLETVAARGETPSQKMPSLTESVASPKVTDPNCPPSPVSSSSNGARPPRRITLQTLPPAVKKNAGKLD